MKYMFLNVVVIKSLNKKIDTGYLKPHAKPAGTGSFDKHFKYNFVNCAIIHLQFSSSVQFGWLP